MIGNGSIAQSKLSHGEKGDFFSINWGWALGVTLGILASGTVSGKDNSYYVDSNNEALGLCKS